MRLHKSLLNKLTGGILVLSVLVFGFTVDVHSQPGQGDPNLTITFDVQLINADVVYLGDLAFNLQNAMMSERGPIFFYLNVVSDQATSVMFGISVVADTDVEEGEVEIFSGLTRPVQLESNQPRHFTSRDLAKGGVLELYRAETINFNGGGGQKIVNAIRSTSRLPDGTYEFYLTAYIPGRDTEPYQPLTEVGQSLRHLRIINPSSVELLSPMDGERLFTQFPLFQWRSDTREVMLRVYEMREGAQSPEEAIQGIPHLEERIPDINQFFYPQTGAGVRTLESGKQYVWYVESVYRTSANREEAIISELNTFSIVDPQRADREDIIKRELERLLDGEYDDIIAELEDGNIALLDRIFHDSIEITMEEFLALMAAIRAGVNNAVIRSVSIR
jgi:hypothetical protein